MARVTVLGVAAMLGACVCVEAAVEVDGLALSAAIGPATARAGAEAGAASFRDELDAFDGKRWQAAQWSNGGYFLNGWHPGQLAFADGRLHITLEADKRRLTGHSCLAGEYRTWAHHGYGLYEARLMASSVPGTITAFFTYTGPAEGTRHDEIDVEIKGDDPTQLQVNYWTDNVEHPTLIPLGFDASAAYHDYAFEWTRDSLRWFVDGALVHEENGSRGALPQVPGKLIFNHWGTTGTRGWSSDYQVTAVPSKAGVEWVSYTAQSELARSTESDPAGPLAGRAY